MISERDLSSVVAAIYEAGIDFSRWPETLGMLAAVMDSPSAGIARQGPAPEQCWNIDHGVSDSFAGDYQAHYHSVNAVWQRAPATPAGSVHTDSMLIPRSELTRTEFFQDFLRPQGIGGMIAAVALLENGRQTVVTVRSHREFDDQQIALYRLLTPHLQRAVQINIKLARAEINHAASMELLDRLEQAVLFVDENSTVLFANSAAETLMRAEAGLWRQRGVLQGHVRSETADLHSAVVRCGQAGLAGGAFVSLSRPGRHPLAVRVTPAPGELPAWLATRPAAILCVTDPDHAAKPPPRLLQEQFGLTRAQAALAVEILEGDGIQAAADRLLISRATARTHLAQIFEKTGAHRQAELLRIITAARPSLRPD
jgi:DNA-binding CsgD family transcriptional regulator